MEDRKELADRELVQMELNQMCIRDRAAVRVEAGQIPAVPS